MTRQLGRAGVIAKKVGMTSVFSDTGESVPVTVMQLEGCRVVGHKTIERDGYSAVQIGAFDAKPKKLNKARKGFYAKQGVDATRIVREFKVADDALLEVGDELTVDHFVSGQKVDVTAFSKGKGFSGAMKRHNFGGLRASHGVSISHRSHGSTGHCQDPGKVFKGKKMAGQYGNKQITTQNLTVHACIPEDNVILLKGAVPGAKNAIVVVKDAVKRPMHKDAPYPAGLIQKEQPAKEAPVQESATETPKGGEE